MYAEIKQKIQIIKQYICTLLKNKWNQENEFCLLLKPNCDCEM